MYSIYIIDDDPDIRENLTDYLESINYEVTSFVSGETALPQIFRDPPDALLLDLQLPGMSGLEILKKVKRKYPEVPVIMITGYADVESAVNAMKMGAWDYLNKPLDTEKIQLIVDKAIQVKKSNDQLDLLQEEQKVAFGDIIGSSDGMLKVYDFIQTVSATDKITVMILGETGTGKEIISKAIHYSSPRAKQPFIEINCSAFQPTLLESELFGYEAGAFTGAKQRKKGLIEMAHEGTFFLDEIGDMSLELQAKMLKVLEEQKFRRVGGVKEINVDTRFISASSKDLIECVENGTFRKDLFYRLNVASIEVPPLRERGEDILLLANHFVKYYAKEFNRVIKGISVEAQKRLLNYSWIGNVRELRNVIERSILFETTDMLTEEIISKTALLSEKRESGYTAEDFMNMDIPETGIHLEQLEKSLLEKAIIKAEGNKSKAARYLNLSRETFKYRLKKYNINSEDLLT